MFRPKTPMRLTACGGKSRKTADGTPVRYVVLAFQLQPFTAEMADDLNVKARLFSIGSGAPLEDVASAKLRIHQPPQKLTIHEAPDEEMPASVTLVDVEVEPILAVRSDKEGPVYSATLTVTFDYPIPRDLLWLFQKVNEQTFVTFDPMGQQSLPTDVEDDEPAED